MRQKKGFLIFLAALSLFILLSSVASSAGFLNIRPVAQEERATVAGPVQEVGPGFVVINGLRFDLPAVVKIIGRDGRPLRDGLQGLKAGEEVEAVVEGKVILKIRVVELFK